jgi:hypothetical protein
MHQIHSADRDEILYPQDVSTRCHACHAGENNGSDGNVNGFMNPSGRDQLQPLP